MLAPQFSINSTTIQGNKRTLLSPALERLKNIAPLPSGLGTICQFFICCIWHLTRGFWETIHRCHGASWAASTKCNNWREMSWSGPRHHHPPYLAPASSLLYRKAGKLLGILCSPQTKTTAYQRHLCHRYDANAAQAPFLFIQASPYFFSKKPSMHSTPPTIRPIVTETQWLFKDKPTLFMKHHIRHDLKMSGQSKDVS